MPQDLIFGNVDLKEVRYHGALIALILRRDVATSLKPECPLVKHVLRRTLIRLASAAFFIMDGPTEHPRGP